MNQATESFVTEARDILDELEAQLMALETDPNREAVDAVFRAMHTIKGSGAMFGFGELAALTHHLENAFERVRDGSVAAAPELIGLALRGRDVMAAMLDAGGGSDGARAIAASDEVAAILEALRGLVGETERRGAQSATPGAPATAKGSARFTVTYRPAPQDMRNGARPDLLAEEVAALARGGTIRLLTDRVPPLDALEPAEALLG